MPGVKRGRGGLRGVGTGSRRGSVAPLASLPELFGGGVDGGSAVEGGLGAGWGENAKTERDRRRPLSLGRVWWKT